MREVFDRAPTSSAVAAFDMANAMWQGGAVGLLKMIVEVDARKAWRDDDCVDMVEWVARRAGVSSWKAARMVAAAHSMDDLPKSTAALRRGDISLDKFVELARFPDHSDEGERVEWAKRVTPTAIRDRADAATRIDKDRTRSADKIRSLSWWWEDASTLSLWGTLPAEQGARFVKAIDRLADKMAVSPEDYGHESQPDTTIEARRADALVAMASAAIAADNDPDRATVMMHVELGGALNADRNAILADGHPVAPEIAEMLICDCRLQTVLRDADGKIRGVGSTQRIVPPWLRRQVEHRDGHRCTFSNCGRKGFTQVHHIVPWPQGQTEIDNLTMLCPAHHRLVHVHGWHVKLAKNGTTQWFRPDWTPYQPRPAPRATST